MGSVELHELHASHEGAWAEAADEEAAQLVAVPDEDGELQGLMTDSCIAGQ